MMKRFLIAVAAVLLSSSIVTSVTAEECGGNQVPAGEPAGQNREETMLSIRAINNNEPSMGVDIEGFES